METWGDGQRRGTEIRVGVSLQIQRFRQLRPEMLTGVKQALLDRIGVCPFGWYQNQNLPCRPFVCPRTRILPVDQTQHQLTTTFLISPHTVETIASSTLLKYSTIPPFFRSLILLSLSYKSAGCWLWIVPIPSNISLPPLVICEQLRTSEQFAHFSLTSWSPDEYIS